MADLLSDEELKTILGGGTVSAPPPSSTSSPLSDSELKSLLAGKRVAAPAISAGGGFGDVREDERRKGSHQVEDAVRRKLGDDVYRRVDDLYKKAGISSLTWTHNMWRESGASPGALGDSGMSHGYYQFYEKGVLGDLIGKYGRKRALEIARDPILSSQEMIRRARAAGVHKITDPYQQTVAFTRDVERPARKHVEQVSREMEKLRKKFAQTMRGNVSPEAKARARKMPQAPLPFGETGMEQLVERTITPAPLPPQISMGELKLSEERSARLKAATSRNRMDPVNLAPIAPRGPAERAGKTLIEGAGMIGGIGGTVLGGLPGGIIGGAAGTYLQQGPQAEERLRAKHRDALANGLATPGPVFAQEGTSARRLQDQRVGEIRTLLDAYAQRLDRDYGKMAGEIAQGPEGGYRSQAEVEAGVAARREETARIYGEIGKRWNIREFEVFAKASGLKNLSKWDNQAIAAAIDARRIAWIEQPKETQLQNRELQWAVASEVLGVAGANVLWPLLTRGGKAVAGTAVGRTYQKLAPEVTQGFGRTAVKAVAGWDKDQLANVLSNSLWEGGQAVLQNEDPKVQDVLYAALGGAVMGKLLDAGFRLTPEALRTVWRTARRATDISQVEDALVTLASRQGVRSAPEVTAKKPAPAPAEPTPTSTPTSTPTIPKVLDDLEAEALREIQSEVPTPSGKPLRTAAEARAQRAAARQPAPEAPTDPIVVVGGRPAPIKPRALRSADEIAAERQARGTIEVVETRRKQTPAEPVTVRTAPEVVEPTPVSVRETVPEVTPETTPKTEVFSRDEIEVGKASTSRRKRENGTDGEVKVEVRAPGSITTPENWARLENTDATSATIYGRLEFETGKAPKKADPVWSVFDRNKKLVAKDLTYPQAVERAKDHVYQANPTPAPVPEVVKTPKPRVTQKVLQKLEQVEAEALAEIKKTPTRLPRGKGKRAGAVVNLQPYVKYVAAKVAKGAVKNADFLLEEFADRAEILRPHLATIWKQARNYYDTEKVNWGEGVVRWPEDVPVVAPTPIVSPEAPTGKLRTAAELSATRAKPTSETRPQPQAPPTAKKAPTAVPEPAEAPSAPPVKPTAETPAAAPEESTGQSVKNRATAVFRDLVGLPPHKEPAGERMDHWAQEAYDQGLHKQADQMAGDVLSGKKKVLNRQESFGMAMRLDELEGEYRQAYDAVEQARTQEGSVLERAIDRLETLRAEVDRITSATKMAGTQQARDFAARKAFVKDYTFTGVYSAYRSELKRPLTSRETAKIAAKVKEHDEAEKAVQSREKAETQKKVETFVDETRKSLPSTDETQKAKLTRIRKDREAILNRAKDKLEKARKRTSEEFGTIRSDPLLLGKAISTAQQYREILPEVKDLAKNFVEEGVVVAGELVEKVGDTFRSIGYPMTNEETAALLSGLVKADPTGARVRSDWQRLQTEIREAFLEEARLIRQQEKEAGAELNEERKKIRRTEKYWERRRELAETRKKKEALREAHKAARREQRAWEQGKREEAREARREYQEWWKNSTGGQKARLLNQIDTLGARIYKAGPDFIGPQNTARTREEVPTDPELYKLYLNRERLRMELEGMRREARIKAESEQMAPEERVRAFLGDLFFGATRSIVASTDVTFQFLQAGQGFYINPKRWAGSWLTMAKSAREAGYADVRAAIRLDPDYDKIRKSGVELPAMQSELSGEEFLISQRIEHLPLLGAMFRSNRHMYDGALTDLRYGMMKDMISGAEAGLGRELDPEELKMLGRTVNTYTGRGAEWLRIGEKQKYFFALRYFWSKVEAASAQRSVQAFLLARRQGNSVIDSLKHPVFKAAAKAHLRVLAGQALLIAGANTAINLAFPKQEGETNEEWDKRKPMRVEINPMHTDFGRLVYPKGNETYTLDLASDGIRGGMAVARWGLMELGFEKTAASGRKVKGPYEAQREAGGTFVEYRLSPAVQNLFNTFGTQATKDKMHFGQSMDPKTWEGRKNLIVQYAPISVQTIEEVISSKELSNEQKLFFLTVLNPMLVPWGRRESKPKAGSTSSTVTYPPIGLK